MAVAINPVFTIKPERMADFMARVKRQRADVLDNEPGCKQFDIHVSDEQPNQVFLYEVYVDADALKAHRETPHFPQWRADIEDMVLARDLKVWDVVD